MKTVINKNELFDSYEDFLNSESKIVTYDEDYELEEIDLGGYPNTDSSTLESVKVEDQELLDSYDAYMKKVKEIAKRNVQNEMDLKIATWNIGNPYLKVSEYVPKVEAVCHLLKNKSIDVLALQEVSLELLKTLKDELANTNFYFKYDIVPNVEIGNSIIKNMRVQYNIFITRYFHSYNNLSFELPYKPEKLNRETLFSLRKRYLNEMNLPLAGVHFFNTHLDYSEDVLNLKQLDTVGTYINRNRRAFKDDDLIVMGNLNRELNHHNIRIFDEEFLKVNSLRIVNNDNTYVATANHGPVDYIIVPNNYEVEELETIKDYKDVSTHYPVYAKVVRK